MCEFFSLQPIESTITGVYKHTRRNRTARTTRRNKHSAHTCHCACACVAAGYGLIENAILFSSRHMGRRWLCCETENQALSCWTRKGLQQTARCLEKKKTPEVAAMHKSGVMVIRGYNRCSLETYKWTGSNVQRSTLCYEKTFKKHLRRNQVREVNLFSVQRSCGGRA